MADEGELLQKIAGHAAGNALTDENLVQNFSFIHEAELPTRRVEVEFSMFAHESWRPAFAGMTVSLNSRLAAEIVIPAKAGIQQPALGNRQ